MRLAQKVAIVIGGSRGMGAATVRAFVAEGAKVVIADVIAEEGEALAEEMGDAARFVHLDITDEAAWQGAVALAADKFGRLDILVNNAGRLAFGNIVDTEVQDFEAVLRTNLIGCFLGIKVAAPAIIHAGGGAIVNISSVEGLRGSPGIGAYGASKWAVRGLTKTAAAELGPRGVRVNSVHPGVVDTPMANPGAQPRHVLDRQFQSVPLQRAGEAAEIARVTLFLASDDASYVNGAEIAVDGGWMAGTVPERARALVEAR